MSASKASSSTIATATRDPFDPQSVLDEQEEEDAAALQEAAEVLQQQLIYNGEIMDAAMEGLRAYKEGTQAIAFLQSSVGLAYALMRMLERWGKNKGDGAYVRRRSKPKKKRKAKNGGEDAGVPDGEEEDAEAEKEEITETMFTFEAFEAKFADPNITASLVTYLARYEDFKSPDSMKQVVSLMHRQAVRAKAEGLYFQVSTLDLFKTIVANQRSLPKDQPYKDLVALINYILRQFFKAVEADSFVLIEAFFPKTRGQWKKLSSWEPEAKTKKPRATVDESRFPPDVQVKKGYTWSEQLAIAMAALTEDGKEELIDWVKVILSLVIAQRRRIIEDVDGDSEKNPEAAEDEQSQLEDDEELKARTQAKGASAEALAKITDYLIPYISDEQAEAATKNAQLKLMFRLVKFFILDEDAEELEWYIPAAVLVSDLQQSLNVIEQFQKSPLDLDGKRASELLRKKTRRRTRRRAPSGSDAEGSDGDEDEPRVKKRKERKKKETQVYKSAQFVQDSDEEYDKGIDEFFEKERQLRERAALTAANHALGIGTMKKTGSKKRRRRNLGKEGDLKRRRAGGGDEDDDDDDAGGGDDNMLAAELSPAASVSAASDAELEDRVSPASPFSQAVSPLPAGPTSTAPPSDDDEPIARAKPKPRPRPRPKTRTTRADSSPTAIEGERLPNSSVGEAAAHAATEKLVSDVQATAEHDSDDEDAEESDANLDRSRAGVVKRKGRLVLSDEPDE